MMEAYEKRIHEYVISHIEEVLKEPRGFIRYPFIDPGSVYDGNVWDWDTYWSVYGILPLLDGMDNGELKSRILTHAKGNVYNFLDHQLPDGYIPMMIEIMDPEATEPYLNKRHLEGVPMNMHKPFLCQQIALISGYIRDYGWADGFRDKLELYFSCYDRDYFKENSGLYVWCNDIMIGMDNDPASFGRPEYSTANIFLNSFMVMELRAMATILRALWKDETAAAAYEAKAENLARAIQAECWDERDKFFYSVDVDIRTRSYDWFHKGLGVFWKTLPIKIRVWSGFLPMLAGFATKEQAKALAGHYWDETTFHSPYGIATLAKDEKMFNLEATNNPSNWLGPIWLVANYAVFKGMLNYGFLREAGDLCANTLKLLGEDLERTGCLHEYYNPFDGSPVMNGGFLNWNILALNMARELREGAPDSDGYVTLSSKSTTDCCAERNA